MKGYLYAFLGLLIGPAFVISFFFGFLPLEIRKIIPSFLVPAVLVFCNIMSLYFVALVIRDYKLQLLGGIMLAPIAYASLISVTSLLSVFAGALYPGSVSLGWLAVLGINVPMVLFLRSYYKKRHSVGVNKV